MGNVLMKVLKISEARKNLAAVLDHVVDDSEECVIPRKSGTAVVLVSLETWNALQSATSRKPAL